MLNNIYSPWDLRAENKINVFHKLAHTDAEMAGNFLKCISTNQALNFAGQIDHTSTPQKLKQPIKPCTGNMRHVSLLSTRS